MKFLYLVLQLWERYDIFESVKGVIALESIAERLMRSMKENNVTYVELAKATGISKSALQRYATGETEKIPLDRLESIAIAIGVSAAYLMGWEDKKELVEHKPDELSSEDSELIKAFHSAPEATQEAIRLLLKGR